MVLAGVFAGLALLTKGPALILLPFAGLLLFAQALAAGRGAWPARVVGALRQSLLAYAGWLAAALLTALLLWPALWAAPGLALGSYWGEIVSNGGRPNGDGQFFLGRAVDGPGPLFYPLATLLRTTPLMLAGLLCAAGLALWDRRPPAKFRRVGHRGHRDLRGEAPSSVRSTTFVASLIARSARVETERAKLKTQNSTLWALLALVLFWTLVMTLGPKKFDRYVLPAWPALLVLAAAGLAEAWRRATKSREPRTELAPSPPSQRRLPLSRRERGAGGEGNAEIAGAARASRRRPWVLGSWFLVLCAVVAELWQPLAAHPYYLSYYNPLLGGGPLAERTLLIGWGEGMDQVGAWLSARPDIGYGPVLSALGRTLQPFVPVDVRDVEDFGRVPANYAVVYLESVQRAANPPLYDALQQTVPLHRVMINGIEYARIYQLPRPFATPLAAQFGAGLRLRGYTLERAPGRLTLTPSWDVRAPLGVDAMAFVHLLDAQGRRVAQLAVAPGGGDAPPTSAWQPGQQLAVPLPLDLPPDLPPGRYTLTLGLFDPATGARLTLAEGPAADPLTAGENALLVAAVELP